MNDKTFNQEDLSLKNLYTQSKLNSFRAGPGAKGLVFGGPVFLLAAGLFFAGYYGLSMTATAISIWFYLAGTQSLVIFSNIINIIRNEKHITAASSGIMNTSRFFRLVEDFRITGQRINYNEVESLAVTEEQKGFLEDNQLITLLLNHFKAKQNKETDIDSEELVNAINHSVYDIAHEHYSYNISVLEFVGNIMPLFGLAGTVYGLVNTLEKIDANINVTDLTGQVAVAMETTLYGAILAIIFKLLASRFKIHREALAYDYNELVNHLKNLFK